MINSKLISYKGYLMYFAYFIYVFFQSERLYLNFKQKKFQKKIIKKKKMANVYAFNNKK